MPGIDLRVSRYGLRKGTCPNRQVTVRAASALPGADASVTHPPGGRVPNPTGCAADTPLAFGLRLRPTGMADAPLERRLVMPEARRP
jgi:hypothetical protein